MKIKSPSALGGPIQAISPLPIVDGAPMAVSGVAATTVATMVSEAVAIYSTTWVHIRLSNAGTPATTNDYIIPADSERVLLCDPEDRLSAIKMTGKADGTLWIWPADYIP